MSRVFLLLAIPIRKAGRELPERFPNRHHVLVKLYSTP
jgi:hypothetical protein